MNVKNLIGLNPGRQQIISLGKRGIARIIRPRIIPFRSVKKWNFSRVSWVTRNLTNGMSLVPVNKE
jgi:hypothetical protein